MPANIASYRESTQPLIVQGPAGWGGMIAPPPRIWPAPPPAHVNGTSAATRYGYSSLAQILPSPQDKGDEQSGTHQPQHTTVFTEEPVKLRKEPKHSSSTTDWRRTKDRSRVKLEAGITPCQVQEVTTSSKHEQNSTGIPVGIAVARQRVQQQSTPPPLTVLTCEERSTNQVTGWTGPPPHWHYPGVDQSLPLQVPPLQLGRDPISGQLLLLPSTNLGDSMQRAVLWPSGNTGNSSAPPPLVMPGTQPVLLDRFVTLAPPPPPSSASSTHHHQEKRRTHDHSTTTIHSGNGAGLTVGLFPPPPPPQAPFLMMPFSHQNNSLLLSTQLTEHNLNTMVVTNHQLSESAVLNPMEVISSPVDGFGGGGMIQPLPPSVVISHTETNSFVRSDINALYPAQAHVQAQPSPQQAPSNQPEPVIIKEEVELIDEATEEEPIEEETKAEVMDASNQTESPVEESEEEPLEEVSVKVENKESSTEDPPPQEPDMSGLELLVSSIAQYESRSGVIEEPHETEEEKEDYPPKSEMKQEERDEWKEENKSISSGLGLLCTVVQRCLEEEVVEETDVQADEPEAENTQVESLDKMQDEEVIETVQISEESQDSRLKETNEVIEKREEWYAMPEEEQGSEVLKVRIKRRPGRPKKKSKTRKHSSPTRCEPPVLQPWSASPGGDKSPLGSPPTLTPHKRKLSQDMSQESDEGSLSSSGNPPPLSPACLSSNISKKRKVGRPKKHEEVSPEKTETIVTKALPCNKAIVDLLMAKKHQDHQQTTGSHKIKPKLKAEAKVKDWCDDEELDLSPGKENELDDPLLSPPPVWQSPPKPKTVPLSPPRKPKVKIVEQPKKEEAVTKSPLRTIIKCPKSPHPTVKSPQVTPKSPHATAKSPQATPKSPHSAVKSPHATAKSPHSAVKSPQSVVKSPHHTVLPQRTPSSHRVSTPYRTPVPQRTSTPHRPSTPQSVPSSPKSESLQRIPDCKLSEEQLKSLPCRILSITNGQFYPGEVTKIIAPDIYEVHIYKERCRKPQILCRDEILSSSVAEVHCPEEMFIPSGTRVCAYWSQQYSCFYPGRVVADSHAGQVPIDFDDGDNGTIERSSIRFLPQDYPIVEQPPNPLIGKRKRYNSTTSSDSHKNNEIAEPENGNTSSEADEKSQRTKLIPEDKKQNKEETISEDIENEKNMSYDSEENSSSEEKGAKDAIMSVLEGFFRSEEEERERLKHGDKIRRRHKHHKHREGCKTHKCKHKHHRSHKHKHSRDESRKSDTSSNSHSEKESVELNGNSSLTSHDQDDLMKDSAEEDSKKEGCVTLANKSKSKIAAFLPEKHEMWSWVGSGIKRGRALGPRGKGLKIFYKAIKRGGEVINLGDCAVFVSTGRPDRPFIGQIESFWQCHMKKNMVVKVSWFYHPEETIGCPDNLPYPGGLFKSPHNDNNDVQTISHRCEVLPLSVFQEKVEKVPGFLDTVYENNETYYLAGHYQPAGTNLTLEPGVVSNEEKNENSQTGEKLSLSCK